MLSTQNSKPKTQNQKLFFLLTFLSFFLTLQAKEGNLTTGNGRMLIEMTANAGRNDIHVCRPNKLRSLTLTFTEEAKMQKVSTRNENMETGELTMQWSNNKGQFTKQAFVSYADNIVAVLFTAQAGSTTMFIKATTRSGRKVTVDGNEINEGGEALIRILPIDGKLSLQKDELRLKNCSQALFLIALTPQEDNEHDHTQDLKTHLDSLQSKTYAQLFERHKPALSDALRANAFHIDNPNEKDKRLLDILYKQNYKATIQGATLNSQLSTLNSFLSPLSSFPFPLSSRLLKSQLQASSLFDRYLYTLDTAYLQNEVLPYMVGVADETEKALKQTDQHGYYIIGKDDPTLEVTAVNFFLRDIISACNILQLHQERVSNWISMLAKLPPYRIDINEEFRRNLLGESVNDSRATDIPHLLGLFYRTDPIISRNYDIRESCRTSIKRTIEQRNAIHKAYDQGVVQIALASAALGDAETAYTMLHQIILNSPPSTHNAASDNSQLSTLNYQLSKMLQQSYYSPETNKLYLNLLAATPKAWAKGEKNNMPTRGGVTITEMRWDEPQDSTITDSEGITATLLSKTDITVDIFIRGRHLKTVDLKSGEPYRFTARKRGL